MFNNLMARSIGLIISASVLSISAVFLLLYCFIEAGTILPHPFSATFGWLCGLLFLLAIPAIPIIAIYSAIGLITRARLLRAALEKDYRLAPLAIVPQAAQPISLEIVATRREQIKNKWALVLSPLLFGFLTFFLFPHILTSGGGAAIGWITAGDFTLILTLYMYWLMGIGTAKRRQFVRVNDEGVTIEWTRRRSQHVLWHELRGFIEIGRSNHGEDGASYWLMTANHVLRFDLWGKDMPTYANVRFWRSTSRFMLATGLRDIFVTQNQQNRVTIEKDDTATYERRARQLLANIVTRSGVPLQTANSGASFSAFLARSAQETIDPSYIVMPANNDELPLAGPIYQPSAAAITEASLITKPVVLRQRIIPGKKSQIIGSGVIIGILLFAGISNRANFLTAFIYIGIVVTVEAIVLRITSRLSQSLQRLYPTIVADQMGIAADYGKRSRKMIPWHRISEWMIVVDTDEEYRINSYIVSGAHDDEEDIIHWFEMNKPELAGWHVQGDRQIAYQQQAALLRAMIAAQTGLPLYAIPISDADDEDEDEESHKQE